jgi:hypothetical protein
VLVSLCYVLLRWLLDFVVLRVRSKELKELEIVVLRHELAILRRKTRRPAITAVDRLFLSAASRLLPARALAILHRDAGDAAMMASAVGRQAVDVRAVRSVVRQCDVRFETWCCGSRERTRGGVIHGLSAN